MLVSRGGFILIAVHVLYEQSPTQRVGELQAIARWLADWAGNVNAYHHNLIVLGDFNIDRKDDPLYQAFTSTGLTVPDALHEVPRTIFGSSTMLCDSLLEPSGETRRHLALGTMEEPKWFLHSRP